MTTHPTSDMYIATSSYRSPELQDPLELILHSTHRILELHRNNFRYMSHCQYYIAMCPIKESLPVARKVSSERKHHSNGCTRHRIFCIEEILEAILLGLGPDGMRTLLLARRVNRTFQRVIANSNSVQRALFFRPDPFITMPMINPLLCKVFHPLFMSESKESWGNVWYDARYFLDLNSFENLSELAVQKKRERLLAAPEASWRRMMVFQPKVSIAIHYCDVRPRNDRSIKVENVETPTMEVVIGEIAKWVTKDAAKHEFRVWWKKPPSSSGQQTTLLEQNKGACTEDELELLLVFRRKVGYALPENAKMREERQSQHEKKTIRTKREIEDLLGDAKLGCL